MSVAAVVTLKPGTAPPSGFPPAGYLPLATQALFDGYWLPTAENAGLDLIVQFRSGVDVLPTQIPQIRAELETFAERVVVAVSPAQAGHITERVARLRDLLDGLDPDSVEEIFIG